MKPRIHYTKPSITELEVAYATDAARNGWGELYPLPALKGGEDGNLRFRYTCSRSMRSWATDR